MEPAVAIPGNMAHTGVIQVIHINVQLVGVVINMRSVSA